MAYNGTHFESLETINPEDDKRAIELIELKKSNGYSLDKTHIAVKSRISQNNPAPATKGPANKAKVNPGEHRNLKHRFKCHGCDWSYDSKIDLTQHNALIHAQRHCIICNAQKYGDNNLNDHTKRCREIRDKKRQENDKKSKARKENNPIKQTNIYMHLMEEGPKNEEKERETLSIKEAQKEIKKTERANKKIKEGIPEGVPKIGELYNSR